MKMKLGVFWLGLLAVTAVAGISPTTASATEEVHFVSEMAHTIYKGEQEESSYAFTDPTLPAVTCAVATVEGTASERAVESLTLFPHFTECSTSSGVAHVQLNGCHYLLAAANPEKHGAMQLVCDAGKQVEIRATNFAGSCTIKTPAQTFAGGVSYTAKGSGKTRDVTASLTSSGITSVIHSDGFGACAFASTHRTEGGLQGFLTMKGFDTEGNQVGVEVGLPIVEFHTETSHTLLTGSQVTPNKYTFGALLGSVECEVATFDGTIAGSDVTSITVKPAYSTCIGVEREVTTDLNGCAYVLRATGTEGLQGTLEIECPTEAKIETTVDTFPEGCTIAIGPQTAGGVVDYKEEGSGASRDLLLTWTIQGLHYTLYGCEIGGTANNGTYAGTVTLKGEDTSGNPKGIWIE